MDIWVLAGLLAGLALVFLLVTFMLVYCPVCSTKLQCSAYEEYAIFICKKCGWKKVVGY